MDKLKPILAQKFWILFGVVLIMPVVGYYMTKGSLAATIEARWKKLDETYKGVPTGDGSPNDQWIKEALGFNEQRTLQNTAANRALFEVQKQKMRWPSDVEAVMNSAEYFKPVSPQQGGPDAQYKYQSDYPIELRKMWEIVDPFEDGKNLRDTNARRKVTFAMSDLYQINTSKWEEIQPSFDVIWGCQEDIWLQTELLNSVARVNANAMTQADAPVRSLGKIMMFGGAKSAGDVGGAGTPSNSGQPSSSSSSSGDGMAFGGAMGGGGRRNETSVSAEIALAEEFAVQLDPSAGAASGGGGSGGGGGSNFTFGADAGSGASSGSGAGSGAGGQGAGAGASAANSASKRYLDYDEKQPFKRRGFYIKVVMDHTKVPDFLAELLNSPYPVEIIRVHQTWFADSGTGGSGGGSGGGGTSSPFAGASSSPFAAAGAQGSSGDTSSADAAASFSGSGAGGSSNSSARAAAPAGTQSAMSDPKLANVSILGVWTIYLPPVVDPNQPVGTPSPAAVPAAASPASAPVVAVPAVESPATTETTELKTDADTAAKDSAAKDSAAKDSAKPSSPEPKEPGQSKPEAEPKSESPKTDSETEPKKPADSKPPEPKSGE